MWRGFCSSARYFAMSSSDRARPNHVPYQVRNGTMMKSAATMISQMLEGRRDFCPAMASTFPPFGFTNSFAICDQTFNHRGTQRKHEAKDMGRTKFGASK